jgi:release factor glutamine methyltransferase
MASADANQRWTTRKLLAWTSEYFTRKGIESPRTSAEILLSHVLSTTRLQLYIESDRPASDLERAAFRELVERAVKHEPVEYLVGSASFFSLSLKVDRRVLIPRPSTETIVEHVMQHNRRTPGFIAPLIADVCTGSGAIALALAKNLPTARVVATDLREDALELARANTSALGLSERIEFRQGDLLEPLAGVRARYLVSNPPYISDAEWDAVAPNVKNFEPVHALRGGSDGLEFIRKLIEHAPEFLDRPGQLLIEIAASQKNAVLDLAKQQPALLRPQVLADHEGLPRVLVADVE